MNAWPGDMGHRVSRALLPGGVGRQVLRVGRGGPSEGTDLGEYSLETLVDRHPMNAHREQLQQQLKALQKPGQSAGVLFTLPPKSSSVLILISCPARRHARAPDTQLVCITKFFVYHMCITNFFLCIKEGKGRQGKGLGRVLHDRFIK